LPDLKCFDRISIGPPVVEGRRIYTIYRVEGDGFCDEFKLINSYEEDLNGSLADKFARLMVLMPAINYGLFSDEIEVRYGLTKEEVEFLKHNMDATARDIFVNRIAKKTGFIKDEYIPKDFGPKDAEVRAKISVKEVIKDRVDLKLDYKKCAVMSSGGKESLLTFGILREIGCDTYACFFNESGRHWFTALTAYRYFKDRYSTLRVWSNVDRFYMFMNRRMKILVPRFERIKADIYPVHLFFFEHFIFSFLPLLYKRRIGNIVMGNEYDDPRGQSYEVNGIKHYNAVYDQTQEFDKYMTEWFRRSGFNFRQWSAVRPISGLIVERILFNRYPELFRLQRSCHRTHMEGERIIPCGKCIKCNGIMTFLLANGINPELIGYKKEDVEDLPNRIEKGLVRLDESELRHSSYLINERYGKKIGIARRDDTVEMLHFDSRNSHFDNIPEEFREHIYRILLQYAKGIVYLQKDEWVPIGLEEALKGEGRGSGRGKT
jgi:hypothetical protein